MAGKLLGNYSDTISFQEDKGYIVLMPQANRPLLDTEVREIGLNLITRLRRLSQSVNGDIACPDRSWREPTEPLPWSVTAIGSSDFQVNGGSEEDPAILHAYGYTLLLKDPLIYSNQNDPEVNLFPGAQLPPASIAPGATRRYDIVYASLRFREVLTSSNPMEVGPIQDGAGTWRDYEILDKQLANPSSLRLMAKVSLHVVEAQSSMLQDPYGHPFFGIQGDPSAASEDISRDLTKAIRIPIAIIARGPDIVGSGVSGAAAVLDLLEIQGKRVAKLDDLESTLGGGAPTQANTLKYVLEAGQQDRLVYIGGELVVNLSASFPESYDISYANRSSYLRSGLFATNSASYAGYSTGLGPEAYSAGSVKPRALDSFASYQVGSLTHPTLITQNGYKTAADYYGIPSGPAESIGTGDLVRSGTLAYPLMHGYGKAFLGKLMPSTYEAPYDPDYEEWIQGPVDFGYSVLKSHKDLVAWGEDTQSIPAGVRGNFMPDVIPDQQRRTVLRVDERARFGETLTSSALSGFAASWNQTVAHGLIFGLPDPSEDGTYSAVDCPVVFRPSTTGPRTVSIEVLGSSTTGKPTYASHLGWGFAFGDSELEDHYAELDGVSIPEPSGARINAPGGLFDTQDSNIRRFLDFYREDVAHLGIGDGVNNGKGYTRFRVSEPRYVVAGTKHVPQVEWDGVSQAIKDDSAMLVADNGLYSDQFMLLGDGGPFLTPTGPSSALYSRYGRMHHLEALRSVRSSTLSIGAATNPDTYFGFRKPDEYVPGTTGSRYLDGVDGRYAAINLTEYEVQSGDYFSITSGSRLVEFEYWPGAEAAPKVPAGFKVGRAAAEHLEITQSPSTRGGSPYDGLTVVVDQSQPWATMPVFSGSGITETMVFSRYSAFGSQIYGSEFQSFYQHRTMGYVGMSELRSYKWSEPEGTTGPILTSGPLASDTIWMSGGNPVKTLSAATPAQRSTKYYYDSSTELLAENMEADTLFVQGGYTGDGTSPGTAYRQFARGGLVFTEFLTNPASKDSAASEQAFWGRVGYGSDGRWDGQPSFNVEQYEAGSWTPSRLKADVVAAHTEFRVLSVNPVYNSVYSASSSVFGGILSGSTTTTTPNSMPGAAVQYSAAPGQAAVQVLYGDTVNLYAAKAHAQTLTTYSNGDLVAGYTGGVRHVLRPYGDPAGSPQITGGYNFGPGVDFWSAEFAHVFWSSQPGVTGLEKVQASEVGVNAVKVSSLTTPVTISGGTSNRYLKLDSDLLVKANDIAGVTEGEQTTAPVGGPGYPNTHLASAFLGALKVQSTQKTDGTFQSYISHSPWNNTPQGVEGELLARIGLVLPQGKSSIEVQAEVPEYRQSGTQVGASTASELGANRVNIGGGSYEATPVKQAIPTIISPKFTYEISSSLKSVNLDFRHRINPTSPTLFQDMNLLALLGTSPTEFAAYWGIAGGVRRTATVVASIPVTLTLEPGYTPTPPSDAWGASWDGVMRNWNPQLAFGYSYPNFGFSGITLNLGGVDVTPTALETLTFHLELEKVHSLFRSGYVGLPYFTEKTGSAEYTVSLGDLLSKALQGVIPGTSGNPPTYYLINNGWGRSSLTTLTQEGALLIEGPGTKLNGTQIAAFAGAIGSGGAPEQKGLAFIPYLVLSAKTPSAPFLGPLTGHIYFMLVADDFNAILGGTTIQGVGGYGSIPDVRVSTARVRVTSTGDIPLTQGAL